MKIAAAYLRRQHFFAGRLFLVQQRQDRLNGRADRDRFIRIHVARPAARKRVCAIISRTIGMRVIPPTSRILSILVHFIFASCITISQIVLHFSTRCRVISSNSSRVSSSLHALAVVMMCTIVVALAAGELDLGGERAALQVLIALQIEQRILAMCAIEFFRDLD